MKSKIKESHRTRTFKQIRNHYEVEKAIAIRLKKASKEERKIIYRTMYDELFRQIPDHPRIILRHYPNRVALTIWDKSRLIEKFINKQTILIEFGPGDCRFAMDICNRVGFVYGVDISDQRGRLHGVPKNFKLIIYDGFNLDLPDNFADVIFSDQLIEHLHSEDLEAHFQLVRRILKPKGIYLFRTPHRFSGPHDISRFFSDQAEGFHLKEWTFLELGKVLRKYRYSLWQGYWYTKGVLIRLPFIYFILIENMLNFIPKRLRKHAARYLLPSVTISAIK